VLADLIASKVAPVIFLTRIYRQGDGSRIVDNAHRINAGEMPVCNGKGSDFFFERYETQDAWQRTIKETALRFTYSHEGEWFFIGGQSGAGKTHICTAAAIAKLKQGKELRYMEWREEVPKIKASITDAVRYADMMKELKEADVLYIDDLFKTGKNAEGFAAQPTAADVNLAFEIINYRYNQPELITIISSERTLIELMEIDEAIAGRIAERSKAQGFCINLKPDAQKNWRMRDLLEL
jgi:DNA replication protein DnaC